MRLAHSQGEWVAITLLVTVKAYPNVSSTYEEVVCVAGVRLDTPEPEWVRLFPVRFRDLPPSQRFKKYEIIRLRAKRGTTDRRAESWKPDLGSIERGDVLGAGGHWPARRRVLEPLIGPTMCELHRGRVRGGSGASLGLVRPAAVDDLRVERATDWSPEQRAVLAQGSLLTERQKTVLEKPPFSFKYVWTCQESGCRGHTQTVVDWEIGEAYRSWRRLSADPVTAIRSRWLDDICAPDRETHFFVGDQHQHPGSFLVLGAFYPGFAPNARQLSLEFASA